MFHPVIDGVWVGLEKEQRSNTIAKQGQMLNNYLNKSTLISKEGGLRNFAWYLPPQGTLPSPTLQRGDPEVAVEPRSLEQLQWSDFLTMTVPSIWGQSIKCGRGQSFDFWRRGGSGPISIFGRSKCSQVGCPWKDLAKCSSDALVLCRSIGPSSQKLGPNLIFGLIAPL